jgi:hypothetical protein
MSSDGIRYVYCGVGPNPANCPAGGGDYAFSTTQQNTFNTAFVNWTNAQNGSNQKFTKVSSSIFGIAPFAVDISRVQPHDLPDGWAAIVTYGFGQMDYNNDGTADEYRLWDARIEVRYDLQSTWEVETMAHEIGHIMGLDDCPYCDITTVTTYRHPAPWAPSYCDNLKVSTFFP